MRNKERHKMILWCASYIIFDEMKIEIPFKPCIFRISTLAQRIKNLIHCCKKIYICTLKKTNDLEISLKNDLEKLTLF